ncbi:MAG: response regulator transcription factor [Flavisolibacter sp.]
MKLLVVEDEIKLLQSIREYFLEEEALCEGATTFPEALRKIEDFDYDCIILDINLPGGSGFDLLRYLREDRKEEGVIVISARNALEDKLTGLELGADDYLVKPFHLSELNARVKALLRRKYGKASNILQAGCLQVDLFAHTAMCLGQPLSLTKNEFNLLLYFMQNRGRVISRRAIAEHIFGEQADELPSLDFVYSYIKNLKRKLKEKGSEEAIHAVYGLGYKLTL